MKHLIVIVSFAIVGWTAPAYSQDAESSSAQEIEQGGPTKTIGIETSTILGAISLEAYPETLKGSQLRAREVVLLPGAKIAVHTHSHRPTVVYVMEGELVEHRSDSEKPVIRRQGDTYFETLGVVHWVENTSPNRTKVLAVDILSSDLE